ncbi:cation:proton antiporter domain-containing protein [Streptomyces roseolus]|uniref:cation:proton antiporter domain-containing protein n=1 Tax=Streptomyces roseolus TaxID=67358 RepID=UPI0016790050|nr:cation:proton antiporter [Streptomyces roseolus]GGR20113.1 cation transporter [Streptomyces roseolus]
MQLDPLLTAVGALALLVATFSAYMRRLPLSGPLVALLTGVVLGPAVLDVLRLPVLPEGHRGVHELCRVLLAVSVMAVALRYPVHDVRSKVKPVALLVAVAMPLMALSTAGVAAVTLGAGLGVAVLLGAALCPTDPVLASSVVTGDLAEQSVPARTRQMLSLESGSNDGLAVPLVIGALAIAGPLTGGQALGEALWQVCAAVAVGVASGWVAGRATRIGERSGAMEPGPLLVFTLLLALLVLGVAGLLGAGGVLAVFVSGLTFNATSSVGERVKEAEADEAVNRFAVLPLFVIFGAMLPWEQWRRLGWQGLLFLIAVLLLRRLPVLLLLKRPLALRWRDAVFLGWFGPIGVSALLYLTLEAHRLTPDPRLFAAGALAVAGSTLAHGLTSSPGTYIYRRAAT